MNEMAPSLRHLNPWSSAVSTVWGGLGVALLEEVTKTPKPAAIPSVCSVLCLWFEVRACSILPHPTAM